MAELRDAGMLCPICGRATIFVEDDEDMGWRCDVCHVVIETGVDDLGD